VEQDNKVCTFWVLYRGMKLWTEIANNGGVPLEDGSEDVPGLNAKLYS